MAAQTQDLRLRVECDGGSRGNPGRAGAGSSVYLAASAVRGQPEELAAEWEFIRKATNNVAEYHGLLNGLKLAIQVAVARGVSTERLTIDVFMDSKLIVEQMCGRWKIKHADMKPLAAQAKELVNRCAKVNFTWVPRAQNKRADQLANRAMDDGESGQWFAEVEAKRVEPASKKEDSRRAIDRLVLIACGTTGKTPPTQGLSPRARTAVAHVAGNGQVEGIFPVGKSMRAAAEEAADMFSHHQVPVREVAELAQKSSAKLEQGVRTVLDKLPEEDRTRHAMLVGAPDDLARIIGWVLGSTRVASTRMYIDDGSLSIAEIPTSDVDDNPPMLRRMGDISHLR